MRLSIFFALCVHVVAGNHLLGTYFGAFPGVPLELAGIPGPPSPTAWDMYVFLAFALDNNGAGGTASTVTNTGQYALYNSFPKTKITPAKVAAAKSRGIKILLSIGGDGMAWQNPASTITNWQTNAISSLNMLISTYTLDGIDLNIETFNTQANFASAWCNVIRGLKKTNPSLLFTLCPFSGTITYYQTLFNSCPDLVSWVNYQIYADSSSNQLQSLQRAAAVFGPENIAIGYNTNDGLPDFEFDGNRRGTVSDAYALSIQRQAGYDYRGAFTWAAELSSVNPLGPFNLEKRLTTLGDSPPLSLQRYRCFINGQDRKEVDIWWGYNTGHAGWACNSWISTCNGQCNAVVTQAYTCRRNALRMDTVRIWWGYTAGDAGWACNQWVSTCAGSCTAQFAFA